MSGAPRTVTCTECGDYQSGDPSGRCYSCRIAEPGYRARQDAAVGKFMAEEAMRLAQTGLKPPGATQAEPEHVTPADVQAPEPDSPALTQPEMELRA